MRSDVPRLWPIVATGVAIRLAYCIVVSRDAMRSRIGPSIVALLR